MAKKKKNDSKDKTLQIIVFATAILNLIRETRSDDCEHLFVSERRPYRQIKAAAVEKIVRNIYGRTEGKIQKHVTLHVLRHTTATMAMESGMPIVDNSKLLGHEKVDTTMIYAHVSNADVQAGHRKHVV